MSDYTVSQMFARKEDAGREIGNVKLVVPNVPWKMDGETLPSSAVAYLLRAGLRTLASSYNDATSFDDAQRRFADKYMKLRNIFSCCLYL